ncbi:exodeoxyribonuclease VII large subunit [Pseudenhygromyxa sp. WMMC2535]|uniref:exodeoxyribonuclease VII large subunit n=1 Tax=Pseudenhygromyxa sp. WMMC2535 TaxID=2712867 RepID=UPI001553B6C0|nr:exodeoxyribonuclease VII large subunit [Pseudenhygromyxa sp. WMMC2535]
MARRGIPFGKPPPAPGGRGGVDPAHERPGPGPQDAPPQQQQHPRGRPGPRIHGVHEVVSLAHRTLERALPALWVEGEVSNLSLPRSGHAYFTLEGGGAALSTAMWATSVRRLRFRLEDGQRLRVFGRLGIYLNQGRFQLYADRAEPAGGVGERTLQLEQLKRRLADEGLFAAARKRPLPPWPRRVGVVTSPTGAAIHDILQVMRRRMPTPVLLSPAKVQGPDAPLELMAALRRLAAVEGEDAVDVIIIGRGGGSLEDLWAFNHEGLARAVAECPLPVVSAVGHEVDVSICDLVADRRAATPSQAAELVVPDREALRERLASHERRLVRGIERHTVDLGARLHGNSSRLERWGQALVRREREHLRVASARLERSLRAQLRSQRARHRALAERLRANDPRARLGEERAELRALERRLLRSGRALTAELRPRLARAAGKLDALSPLSVLGRGYALVRDDEGRVIRDAAEVERGDRLALRLARGALEVSVEATHGADPAPTLPPTPQLGARGETQHDTSLGPSADGVVAKTCGTPGTAAFWLRAPDENPGARSRAGFHHGLLDEGTKDE